MILRAQGLLFDLDGTLINSLPAVDRAWGRFARRHGMAPNAEMLANFHGRRSIDTIRTYLPHVDHEAENDWLRLQESTDTEGVVALPGAHALLESLPLDRWCLVTSGTSDVARARLAAVGLPLPRFAVFGEDVKQGKPHPEPFEEGARRLGFAPSECVGFEDTDAGLASIRASGARPVAVGRPPLADLTGVRVIARSEGLELELPEEALG